MNSIILCICYLSKIRNNNPSLEAIYDKVQQHFVETNHIVSSISRVTLIGKYTIIIVY